MNKYYNHWNDFIKSWLKVQDGPSYVHNSVRKDFDAEQLKALPSSFFPDLSREYIPEPWWGNNGNDPLYSVCINLNPGGGDLTLQSIRNSQLRRITDYSDIFGLLPKTNLWHSEKRAKPIGEALLAAKGFKAGQLENHLSIELIPWHTKHADSAHGYWKYVRNSIKEVFLNSFMFAVDESERIIGPLNKTVVLRFSENDAQKVFKYFKKNTLINSSPMITPMTGLSNPNVHATVFTFPKEPNLQGHRFVAIWRSKGFGLNNFPDQESMKEIIRQL